MVVSTIYTCALSCKSEQDVRACARRRPNLSQVSSAVRYACAACFPAPHRV